MTITDKMLHFSISFLTFSTVYLYCHLLDSGLFWCFMTAFVATLIVGITKEVIDKVWDWKDILADAAGIVSAMIIIGTLLLI